MQLVLETAARAAGIGRRYDWRSAAYMMAALAAIAFCGAVDARAADGEIKLELNKLEDQQSSCRAYVVVDNTSDKSYEVLKLDLVLFQTDGIIGRRFALDLAPLRAKKRSVKLFDLDGVKCADVGSFLINDVLGCKAGSADEGGCLDRIAVTSRTKVELSK